MGVVRHGKALQVIVGLDVPQVLESIQGMMTDSDATITPVASTEPIATDPESQAAAMISDSLGMKENIVSVSAMDNDILVKVKDVNMVDHEDVFEALNLGITHVATSDDLVTISIPNAKKIAEKMENLK